VLVDYCESLVGLQEQDRKIVMMHKVHCQMSFMCEPDKPHFLNMQDGVALHPSNSIEALTPSPSYFCSAWIVGTACNGSLTLDT
jgi:hypothetical protein